MSLISRDFPPGTPLHHFFAWNEAVPRWRRDRRYRLVRNPELLSKAVAQALQAAIGSADIAAHAAVFAAFEQAARRGGKGRRRILVIRLSALGDFIQALGPIAAIRRHHAGDLVSLLTTRPLAGFAEELSYFDEVMVYERPSVLAIPQSLRMCRLPCAPSATGAAAAADSGKGTSAWLTPSRPRRPPLFMPGCCGRACRN